MGWGSFTRWGGGQKIVPSLENLVTRPKSPPYRDTAVAVFSVVSQTIGAAPPLLCVKMAYSPQTRKRRKG